MNHFAKLYLTLLVLTTLSTAFAIGFGMKAAPLDFQKDTKFVIKFLGDEAGEPEPFSESFEIPEGFEAINVEWISGDIEVLSSDVSMPQLIFSGTRHRGDEAPFRFRVHNRTLSVQRADGPTHLSLKMLFTGQSLIDGEIKVRLLLPKTWTGDIDIDAVSSDVTINDVAAKKLNVESVSGDVRVSGHAEEIGVETVSGDIALRLPEDRQWNFSFDTTSGDIDNALPSRRDGAPVEIETVSGNISIGGFR